MSNTDEAESFELGTEISCWQYFAKLADIAADRTSAEYLIRLAFEAFEAFDATEVASELRTR